MRRASMPPMRSSPFASARSDRSGAVRPTRPPALRSWGQSAHRDLGDHPLRYVWRAALAIADEAQQGVFARLGEIDLGDLLLVPYDSRRIGGVRECERRLGASPSRE